MNLQKKYVSVRWAPDPLKNAGEIITPKHNITGGGSPTIQPVKVPKSPSVGGEEFTGYIPPVIGNKTHGEQEHKTYD